MGDVVTCRGCKKFFNYLPRGLCEDCLNERDEVFKQVRNYVYANPGATISDVSAATGVEIRVVRELIRDGDLQWTPSDALDAADVAMQCELCGAAISGGRHCDKCRQRLLGGLQPVDDEVHADNNRYKREPMDAGGSGMSSERRMWRRT